jgi:hypothetical protein
LMTVLALLSIQPQPLSAQSGCMEYCNSWAPTGDCCWGSIVRGRLHRQCTDGVGHFCDEYQCSGACAV